MVKGPTYQCYDSDEDGEIGVEDLYLKDGVEQDRTAWEKETGLTVSDVTLEQQGDLLTLRLALLYEGETREVSVTIGGE